jgi:hypothetical protein
MSQDICIDVNICFEIEFCVLPNSYENATVRTR